MAKLFSFILLVLLTVSTNKIHPPSKQTPPPPPPTATAVESQEDKLEKIINALLGSGEFAGWVNIISTADPSSLPPTATFFIPGDDKAVSNLTGTPPLDEIAYHVVPQRLTFADLQKLVARTRLPTLSPAKYIVVTNSSPENLCVDDSRITHPDVFVDSAFAVHGVRRLLEESVYHGGGDPFSPPKAGPFSPPKAGPPKNGTPTKGSETKENIKPFLRLRFILSGLILVIFSITVVVIFKTWGFKGRKM